MVELDHTPRIEVGRLSKYFDGRPAVSEADLIFEPGEVHAIVGENGAGKTTLMNMLFGLLQPDSGHIAFDGETVTLRRPRDAIRRGIGMVLQHFALAPGLTAAQNITLGYEPGSRFWTTPRLSIEAAAAVVQKSGMTVALGERVSRLSIGQQQRVEILKSLYRGARILILDEPTGVLAPQEAAELCDLLRAMAADGTTIIFISHKLPEVLRVADRITVMRQSRVVKTVVNEGLNAGDLARMMTGYDRKPPRKSQSGFSEVVLRISDINTADRVGSRGLKDVSMVVRGGEIIGVAAIEGNGQSDLARVLTGLQKVSSGRITVGEFDITNEGPARIRSRGVGHVPEERHRYAMAAGATAAETFEAVQRRNSLAPVLGRGFAKEVAEKMREFDVRPPRPELVGSAFSGGNQQKLVFARELGARDLQLLILGQPTRGVDVGASDYLHQRIIETAQTGTAVVLISAELDELFVLADRVIVLFEGRVVAELDPKKSSQQDAGTYMTGAFSNATE